VENTLKKKIRRKMKKVIEEVILKRIPLEKEKKEIMKTKHNKSHIGVHILFKLIFYNGYYWPGLRTMCEKITLKKKKKRKKKKKSKKKEKK
jgi:hypothetical protein